MGTVSENMLYINLSKINIHDDSVWIKFINQIKHSLSIQPSLENKIMVVKIQDVTSDDSTMIPKLEHKNI
jgi:hypothetical protein